MIHLLISAAVAVAAPAGPACPEVVTPDALVCRALEAQKAGDAQSAAQAFEEAAKASSDKDPKTARLYAAAGNLWIEAKQPGRAAFALDRAHAHDVATLLDRQGIAVRAGHHCAEPLMHRFGLESTARASFAIYTTHDEIDYLADTLSRVREFFR